jgi:hypothetical protein
MSAKVKLLISIVALLAGILTIGIGLPILSRNKNKHPLTHSQIAGPPALKATADKLKNTFITAHLEHEITGGKNILWCATFQIAWNELCDLLGGEVHLENAPEMVAILNKKSVTRSDLDESSFVAMAGFVDKGVLEKIAAELEKKFQGQASPELLPHPGSLAPELWVAYAYLFKALPFEWAFKRLKWPLSFGNVEVECFGIQQYLKRQRNEVKAASQLLIYDYRSPDDFIIELKTRAESDRLFLAKIPPSTTLAETIASIQKRVAQGKPTKIHECDTLKIPVLNFDLMCHYRELYYDGSPFAVAKQHIRFKLDETGAVLKSEALDVSGIRQDLIFNKPFLIMIQRTDAHMPYFALWVSNAELLVPFRETSR